MEMRRNQFHKSNITTGVFLGLTSMVLAPNLHAQTVLDLQKSKIEKSIELPDASLPDQNIKVRFVNLNPETNAWYLVLIKWPKSSSFSSYHIENPNPKTVSVDLDAAFPQGLTLVDSSGQKTTCALWSSRSDSALEKSVGIDRYYVELCDSRLYTRRPAVGKETPKELVTDFLRRHVWGGEQITTVVKEAFFKDKFLISSELKNSSTENSESKPLPETTQVNAPAAALINDAIPAKFVMPEYLGIDLGPFNGTSLEIGKWYSAGRNPGVFVSVVEPKVLRPDLLSSYPDRARKLDDIEAGAVAYLVGFDLSQYDLGFTIGTKHPSFEWSERTLPEARNPKTKGPDGFDNIEPLVLTGSINPTDSSRVMATFTGGFKRSHGAFKWGVLAKKNKGSHYGYIENGVVLSSLSPDLATMIIYNHGGVDIKTWSEADNADLPKIRHARQNGVPLTEWDNVANRPIPGSLVSSWHLGNWSGSQDSAQRALRAGACLASNNGRDFLIYGYFSSATPNAMARVFQAYNCRYSLHLDMNALEHTYLAIYSTVQNGFSVQHLITGMHVLDRQMKGGVIIPRFVGTADNRDFFFLMKK